MIGECECQLCMGFMHHMFLHTVYICKLYAKLMYLQHVDDLCHIDLHLMCFILKNYHYQEFSNHGYLINLNLWILLKVGLWSFTVNLCSWFYMPCCWIVHLYHVFIVHVWLYFDANAHPSNVCRSEMFMSTKNVQKASIKWQKIQITAGFSNFPNQNKFSIFDFWYL